jgi:hypothetical protein
MDRQDEISLTDFSVLNFLGAKRQASIKVVFLFIKQRNFLKCDIYKSATLYHAFFTL